MTTSTGHAAPGFGRLEVVTMAASAAVLAALLIPAAGVLTETSNKAGARRDLARIVHAVKSYHQDYGTYPLVPV